MLEKRLSVTSLFTARMALLRLLARKDLSILRTEDLFVSSKASNNTSTPRKLNVIFWTDKISKSSD